MTKKVYRIVEITNGNGSVCWQIEENKKHWLFKNYYWEIVQYSFLDDMYMTFYSFKDAMEKYKLLTIPTIRKTVYP